MILNSRDYHSLMRFKTLFFEDEAASGLNPEYAFLLAKRYLNAHQNMMQRNMKAMSKKEKSSKQKFEWRGYVNIQIPPEHNTQVEKYISDTKTVFMALTQMIADGYRLKLEYDDNSEGAKATAICHDADDPNYGCALSAWASDWQSALSVLCYKHYKISDQHWSEYKNDVKRSFG